MSDDTKAKRFYFIDAEWLGDTPNPYETIMIGVYHDDGGGCEYEFSVRFYSDSIHLGIWSNTWKYFDTFSDVISLLAEIGSEIISPDQFAERLKQIGYAEKMND